MTKSRWAGFALLVTSLAATTAAVAAAGPLTYCGTIKAYQAASATTDGSITIGSRTYAIAAGTAPSTALSGPGGDRCVSGETDGAGRFVRLDSAHPYGAVGSGGVTYTVCGTVADYQPPAGGRAGLLILHELGRETIVPAGTSLPLSAGANPGDRCFSAGLNGAGDAIITGIAPVIGAGGSPRPTVAALPSTSSREEGFPLMPIAAILALLLASVLLPALRVRRPEP